MAERKDPGPPENHPGSRYGTAPEDRPDLAPEAEPLHANRPLPWAPEALPGDLPENRAEDPSDTGRKPRKKR